MSLFGLAFLAVYFGGLLKALTSNPIFGLYVYIFAFYLDAPSRWWGGALPDLRWSFTAAAVTLVSILIRKNYSITGFKHIETKLLIMFAIFVMLQSFWAIVPAVHSDYSTAIVKFIILILLMHSTIKTKADLMGFIAINLVGCIYYAYLGATRTQGGRLDGIGGPSIGSANQLGQHLAAVLFFCAYAVFVKTQKLWFKIFIIIGLALILKTIFMTGSRGVFVALGGVGFLTLFFVPKVVKKEFRMYAILGVIAVFAFTGPMLIERFESMQVDESSGEITDMSARSRIVILEAQIEMIKDAPILGKGHRTTLLLSPLYIPAEYLSNGGTGVRASHNLIASLFTDHGLIGASLYLMVIFLCLKRIFYFKVIDPDLMDQEEQDLRILGLGFCFGLLSLIASGMTSNNKMAETDMWLYALIPICHRLVLNKEKERKNDT